MFSMKHILWLVVALLALGVLSGCVPHRPGMHHPHHLQNSVVEPETAVV